MQLALPPGGEGFTLAMNGLLSSHEALDAGVKYGVAQG
jgi:hypothetical protein